MHVPSIVSLQTGPGGSSRRRCPFILTALALPFARAACERTSDATKEANGRPGAEGAEHASAVNASELPTAALVEAAPSEVREPHAESREPHVARARQPEAREATSGPEHTGGIGGTGIVRFTPRVPPDWVTEPAAPHPGERAEELRAERRREAGN